LGVVFFSWCFLRLHYLIVSNGSGNRILTDKTGIRKDRLFFFSYLAVLSLGVFFSGRNLNVFAPFKLLCSERLGHSVVMRIMSGNGQTPTGWLASVNAASNQIRTSPVRARQRNAAAQVVIQPKSAAAGQTSTPAAAVLLRPLKNPKHR